MAQQDPRSAAVHLPVWWRGAEPAGGRLCHALVCAPAATTHASHMPRTYHASHIPCFARAMLRTCHASHMPCLAHAMLRTCHASHMPCFAHAMPCTCLAVPHPLPPPPPPPASPCGNKSGVSLSCGVSAVFEVTGCYRAFCVHRDSPTTQLLMQAEKRVVRPPRRSTVRVIFLQCVRFPMGSVFVSVATFDNAFGTCAQ